MTTCGEDPRQICRDGGLLARLWPHRSHAQVIGPQAGVRRQPGVASGGRRYGALAEHPVLLAKGYALVAVVEQEGQTVAATPMTAAMNGTSGPAREPSRNSAGDPLDAATALMTAPPWRQRARRRTGTTCCDGAGRPMWGAHRTSPAPRRRGERGQRSAATAGGASGRAHLPFLPRACEPTSGCSRLAD
jgi:hypothetical protein